MPTEEETIYRLNLLAKNFFIDLTTFFLNPEKNSRKKQIQKFFKLKDINIEYAVQTWYEKQKKILQHQLHQTMLFSSKIVALPYDLETIQQHIRFLLPFYQYSFVIQCAYGIDITPEKMTIFLPRLPEWLIRKTYWLARANNQKTIAHFIFQKYPRVHTTGELFCCFEEVIKIGDLQSMNGLWKEQQLLFAHSDKKDQVRVLQKTVNMACAYGRLIFLKQILHELKQNNLFSFLSLEKMFAQACRSGDLSIMKFIISLFRQRNSPPRFQFQFKQLESYDPLFHVCMSGQLDAVNFLLTTIPASILQIVIQKAATHYVDAAIHGQNLEVFHRICHLLPKPIQDSVFSAKNNFVYRHLQYCPYCFLVPFFEKIPPENLEAILSKPSYIQMITMILCNDSHLSFYRAHFLLSKMPREKKVWAIAKIKYHIQQDHYLELPSSKKEKLLHFLHDCATIQNNTPSKHPTIATKNAGNPIAAVVEIETDSFTSTDFEDYLLELDSGSTETYEDETLFYENSPPLRYR